MKLIIKERASGKTTMLINTSAVTGFPIVVNNRIQVTYLLRNERRYFRFYPKATEL